MLCVKGLGFRVEDLRFRVWGSVKLGCWEKPWRVSAASSFEFWPLMLLL